MWRWADGPEDGDGGDPNDVGTAWIVTFAGDERVSSEGVAEGRWITRAEARRLAETEGYELAFFDEILVGFDARDARAHDPGWNDERRQRSLLRPEVARPLSVDNVVWPTIFDGPWEEVQVLDGPQGKQIGVTWVYDRRVIGPNAPLWHDLDRMKGRLAEQGAGPADVVLVAVAWCFRWNGEPNPYPEGIWGPYAMVDTEPEELEESWTLLGYDVAGGSLNSSLVSFYRTPEDGDRLREKWAPKLNEHHLLHDQDAAFAFAEDANTGVPAEYMQHVYSLYRLP